MINGYKETKVGLIPNEWSVVPQSEVATFFNGRAYKQSEWETSGTPVIRLQNLTGTGKDYYYSNLELPEHQYCHRGDLLYMWSATFGPVWWFGDKAIFHYHIWKVEHNAEKLNKWFHFYLLDEVTRRMKNESHGSTMLHVTKGGMEKLLIQLPPLPEQQKIAEILSTVDKKIAVIDQQITETQELKKGLMQRLLTKGIGHTEFKDSPLGKIPLSWEVVNSSKVFELIHGYQFRDYDFTDVGLPIVKIGQINRNGEIDMTGCSFFSFEREDEFTDKRIFNGDVLMALTGATLGKSCWVEGLENPVYQNYRVGKFVPHDESVLSKRFLYYLIGSPLALDQIMSKINSGAQGNVGKSDFQKLKITLPPIEEQHKISSILSSVDEKLNLLAEKKTHYQELKHGLMQQLLTGKVRLKVAE